MKKIFLLFFIIILTFPITIGVLVVLLIQNQEDLIYTQKARFYSYKLSQELKVSSKQLTRFSRTYAMTGDSIWKSKYYEVLAIRNGQLPRKNGRFISLKDSIAKLDISERESDLILKSETKSNALTQIEIEAFKAMEGLFLDSLGQFSIRRNPDPEFAQKILFDENYHRTINAIMAPLDTVVNLLDEQMHERTLHHHELSQLYLRITLFLTLTSILILVLWLILSLQKLKEQKKAMCSLRKSEQQFREMIEKTPLAIIVSDNDEKIIYTNNILTQEYGYRQEDLDSLESRWELLFPDKAYRETARSAYLSELNNNTNDFTGNIWRIRDKHGRERHCRVSLVKIGELILSIAIDLTDRIQNEKLLEKSILKAKESDQLKSAFLANMSHEIRTPMNAILGFTSLLRDFDIPDKEYTKYLDYIESSGNQLLHIISDIISISKIESGQLSCSKTVISVNQVLEELFSIFKTNIKIREKKIELRLEKGESQTNDLLITDPNQFKQIFTHLLNNALKFTDEGHIQFGYQKEASHFLFYVSDTGIGIPEQQQRFIFEHFKQGDRPDNKVKEGTGLGLTISKALIEFQGGSIWVESQPGEGSTFKFRLPIINNNEV